MTLIDHILKLTDEVQAHIDQGNWSDASALDAKRQELLVELLDNGGADRLDADSRNALRQVLTQNQRAMELVRAKKNSLAEDFGRMKAKSVAVESYRVNAVSFGTQAANQEACE